MNMTKLDEDLNNYLHGQHLVKLVLLKHLKSHLYNNNPSKALLLSFNGMTGTGKNFVSSMIASSIYKKGKHSSNCHLFVSALHFPQADKLDIYKADLQKKITESVRKCPRSLFIFDEVHDMPVGLLDAIKPFVDTHESIDGVDFRKAIFILLSNSGGKDINSKLLETVTAGKSRESLSLKEMDETLSANVFKMKNDGLRNSKLITHNLVTAFVPFLPLERRHVVLCIKDLLREKGHPDDTDTINKVLESLNFAQTGSLEIAYTGCKKISEKVELFL